MFPVSAVPAQSEGFEALPGAEAPGRGIIWKGHAGITQEERSVHFCKSVKYRIHLN